MEYNLGGNGKSQILGTAGFIKVVRQVGGPVVGIHMVGSRVGEQIGGGPAHRVLGGHARGRGDPAARSSPQNEAMGEAHMALAGKPLHAHG